MRIIDNQKEFDQLCLDLDKESIIFMDTEFCRRRTYYAILSIIQIATINQKIIIDVLSGIKIDALKNILLNKKICKVFHAPDQDFDILYHIFGKLPENVFDTQIAAGVIGLDEVMGYARLCKALININLDKSLQKADWLERPLAPELLKYAIKDVEYLIPLHRELTNAIDSRNLWDTYKTRSAKLLDPASYKINLEKIIKKVGIQDRSISFREKFCHLVMFRETVAQNLDVPRGYCANDYQLIELCEKLPINDNEFLKLNMQQLPISKKNFKNKLFELCLGLREEASISKLL